MFLSFGLVFNAILFALGIYWCYEMAGRWRSDLEDLRQSEDNTQKLVIIGFWLLTLIIALLVINFAWGLITNVIQALGNS